MDPFDEFEIKPLTEGLGFHKKSIPLNQQVKASGLIDDQTLRVPTAAPGTIGEVKPTRMQSFDDILKALEKPNRKSQYTDSKSDLQITQPLPTASPRKAALTGFEIPAPTLPPPSPAPLAKKRHDSPLSKVVENVGLRRGASDSPQGMLERAPMSVASALLDAVVVFALSLVFLVTLMTVTKVDLASIVMQIGLDIPTKISFIVLSLSVLMMYVVVTRSFFGRTLGEWTFDYQMGDDKQHRSAVYPLKVLFRSIIVVLSGLVVIPILSWLVNKDLLAPVTGLQLYRSR